MSIIERDIERCFLELHPLVVFAIVVITGIGVVFLIEIVWGHWVTRMPNGSGIFRYWTNFLGDPFFLAGIVGIYSEFTRRVHVSDSFLTSSRFSILTIVLGFALGVLFVTWEETSREWPKELSFFHNPNRIYHFVYFSWLAGLLIAAAIRMIKYGLIDGNERGLTIVALILFGGYVATFVLDTIGFNPIWNWLREKHPMEAAHVEGTFVVIK